MSGYEFEDFISSLVQQQGYKVEQTTISHDQGVDIIASKQNLKIAIQTKCYANPIGNKAVQEVVAGAKYYNCNKKMVFTNSTFTSLAIELARVNDVVLIDRQKLVELIEKLKPKSLEE